MELTEAIKAKQRIESYWIQSLVDKLSESETIIQCCKSPKYVFSNSGKFCENCGTTTY